MTQDEHQNQQQNTNPLSGLSDTERNLLSELHSAYEATTQKLTAAYRSLQDQVAALDAQLAERNQQLAEKVQELDHTHRFLDSLIDSMQQGLLAINPQGQVSMWNTTAENLLGWTEEDLLEHGYKGMLPTDSCDPVLEVLQGGATCDQTEGWLMTNQGERLPVLYSTSVVRDAEGQPQGAMLVFSDLRQIRSLQERARRADRLTALGELAAGVAHEMRNPLTTMRGFLQILPEEYDDPSFRQEFSSHVVREIDRLARLTDDLLDLSKPIQSDMTPEPLEKIAQTILTEINGHLQQQDIDLVFQGDQNQACVCLDSNRFRQVFLNMMINAQQAMPHGGTLEITVGTTHEEASPMGFIKIKDSGVGIPPEKIDHIFDPFFTTKDHGTGLGLALSHRIIEEHHGFIRVASEPEQGTIFTILLPLAGGK